MHNIGEEIAGEYLQRIIGCDFVQYNLDTPDTQGEIDVLGIHLGSKAIYICEVAIHTRGGLNYVNSRNREPDNVGRFIRKFEKGIAYAKRYFPNYQCHLLLWSPIVKKSRDNSKNCQWRDVCEIQSHFQKTHQSTLHLIVNETFLDCLQQLRLFARNETKELKSPILRLMQIEETLKKHIKT
jgi:hypothetical protein